MKESQAMQRGRGFLAFWVLLFCIWLAATGTLSLAPVLCGLVLTCVIAYLASKKTAFWSGLDIRPARLVAGLRYLLVFLREMVLSNIAVLGYVYAPRVHTVSRTVRVPVRITGPRERLALTNTIALTPGTLAVDLVGQHIDIHVLDEELASGVPASVLTFEDLLEKAVG